MSTANKVRLGTVLALILTGLCVLGFSFWRDYHKNQGLIKQNIYEIDADFHENGQVDVYYMVCRPAETEEGMRQLITSFLSDGDIITILIQRWQSSVAENVGQSASLSFSLIFIHPTGSWPIGRFPTQKVPFVLGYRMGITSVYASSDEPDALSWRFDLQNLSWNH